MFLINGAKASNVFWRVVGAINLGANSVSYGTLLSAGAVTLGIDAQIEGRIITKDAAITLGGSNIVTKPAP